MEELGKSIGVLVGGFALLLLMLLVLVGAAVILPFVFTMAAMAMSLLLFKTKVPLVHADLNAPLRFGLAASWAAAMSISMVIGSFGMHEYFEEMNAVDSRRLLFLRSLDMDWLQFFIETTFAIFLASQAGRAAPGGKARSGTLYSAIGLFLITLPLIQFSRISDPVTWVVQAAMGPVEVVRFAFARLPEALTAGDVVRVFSPHLNQWFWSTGGNLFAIVSGLSKVLWLVVGIKYLFERFDRFKEAPVGSVNNDGKAEEAMLAVMVGGLTAALWFSMLRSESPADAVAFMALILLAGLWYLLFKSRFRSTSA